MWHITAGLVTEITRALSMAILTSLRWAFSIWRTTPLAQWGAMLGDALELIYVAPWTATGGVITISVLLVNRPWR